jgi:hypothetical protein
LSIPASLAEILTNHLIIPTDPSSLFELMVEGYRGSWHERPKFVAGLHQIDGMMYRVSKFFEEFKKTTVELMKRYESL